MKLCALIQARNKTLDAAAFCALLLWTFAKYSTLELPDSLLREHLNKDGLFDFRLDKNEKHSKSSKKVTGCISGDRLPTPYCAPNISLISLAVGITPLSDS